MVSENPFLEFGIARHSRFPYRGRNGDDNDLDVLIRQIAFL